MDLLNFTCSQLTEEMGRRYGCGAYHANALYRAFYRSADLDLNQLPPFTASARLRHQVVRELACTQPVLLDRTFEQGVTKLVFQLSDGYKIETVVIPMANHATVCISCQAGCRMGCRFCRTGRMGLKRNLTAGEIVAQVYAVKVRMGLAVRNVVFMGMGEPLDNFDQVVQAIRIMEDQRGLDIAKRHMTLSTAGLVDGIKKLARLDWPRLKLAVSLNAPCDDLRNGLMPINRQYPMSALKQCLTAYPLARGNAILMEYVLMQGVNDDPLHASRLAAYFKGLRVKMNLIACNPGPDSSYRAPPSQSFDRFHQALIEQGIFVRVRSSKGAGISAACGQLGGRFDSMTPNSVVPA